MLCTDDLEIAYEVIAEHSTYIVRHLIIDLVETGRVPGQEQSSATTDWTSRRGPCRNRELPRRAADERPVRGRLWFSWKSTL